MRAGLGVGRETWVVLGVDWFLRAGLGVGWMSRAGPGVGRELHGPALSSFLNAVSVADFDLKSCVTATASKAEVGLGFSVGGAWGGYGH